ncbi:MAG: Fic family protein [Vibrionaceae bacterium]|nr:Fic family protein [Vibrionaceae bacterium]
MWIWEQPSWPHFIWDDRSIEPLVRTTRLNLGILIGKMWCQPRDQTEQMLDTLLANIVHSSAIEGETLNAFSVRSSLATRLGISEARPFPTTKQTDALAEMVLDALNHHESPLTLERVLHWHTLLFREGNAMFNPRMEGKLRDDEPMRVVSGWPDKPVVHFEAPPRGVLNEELSAFIAWFNESKTDVALDPLLRAAITHLWFVTLHPLDDGNGRITRLLTDVALTQAEPQSVGLYAMSVGIFANRKRYYEILEQTQKGEMDITAWLTWFLDTLNETFEAALKEIEHAVLKTNFWRRVDQTRLSSEQSKVLNRMLDGDFPDGINTSLYAKVMKVSKPTATRHLAALVEIGCLVKSGAGGRSTRYFLLETVIGSHHLSF